MASHPKTIIVLGRFLESPLTKILKENGYEKVVSIKNPAAFAVKRKAFAGSRLVIGSFAASKANRNFNRFCLQENIAWLPYRFIAERNLLDIGPVIDGKGACYACYETRLRENKVSLRSHAGRQPKEYQLVMAMHVVQAVDLFFAGRFKPVAHQSHLFSLRYPTALASYRLLRNPLCPVCGGRTGKKKIIIKPRTIVYRENGLRTVSANKTWEKANRFIHHAGILTALVERKKPGNRFSAFQAISADPLGNNRFRTHAGKGISLTQNKLSATLEGIERYCAKYAMLDPFREKVTAPYAKLKGKALHPDLFQMPLEDYTDDEEIAWTPAFSLTKRKRLLVPLDYVSLIPIGSNGLASGNCIEEAILHAIFELIERDIYMITDLQGLVMPDLDTASITHEPTRRLLQEIEASGITYRIKFLKTDTDIPTFGMFMKGTAGGKEAYAHAVCSHLDRDIALSRTVTEAIQLYPKWKTGTCWLNKNTGHYSKKTVPVMMKDIPSYRDDDLKNNLDRCIGRLKQVGLDAVVVDHSLPGLGFHVVRVLIPGLQPIWFRESNYLVDRVFTLPGKLGFPAKPRERLNYGQFCGFPYAGQQTAGVSGTRKIPREKRK